MSDADTKLWIERADGWERRAKSLDARCRLLWSQLAAIREIVDVGDDGERYDEDVDSEPSIPSSH